MGRCFPPVMSKYRPDVGYWMIKEHKNVIIGLKGSGKNILKEFKVGTSRDLSLQNVLFSD